jgi:hypothetical protein
MSIQRTSRSGSTPANANEVESTLHVLVGCLGVLSCLWNDKRQVLARPDLLHRGRERPLGSGEVGSDLTRYETNGQEQR